MNQGKQAQSVRGKGVGPARALSEAEWQWELAHRKAVAMAACPFLCAPYKGNPAACAMAIELAASLRTDPYQVAAHLKMGDSGPYWAAPFVIAQCNRSGKYASSIYYKESGHGDDREVRACVKTHEGTEIVGPPVSLKMMRSLALKDDEGSLFRSNPELALNYRSASYLVRTNAPEVLIALPAPTLPVAQVDFVPARDSADCQSVTEVIGVPPRRRRAAALKPFVSAEEKKSSRQAAIERKAIAKTVAAHLPSEQTILHF